MTSSDLPAAGLDETQPVRQTVRFFLPGPSYVPADLLAIQQRQPIAHRSAAFAELYARAAERLSWLYRTAADVVVATSSATLVMQAAVASVVKRRVLCLVCGAFSERWHAIAQSLGKEADRIEVPYGAAVDPGLVRRALERQRYDAVTMTHCETSSGVLNPIAELAREVRDGSDALVVVDAVSSLAGAPLETDAWGLDVVVSASQKALALPPGLAFAAVSRRAEERMGEVAGRGYYTDLVRYLAAHRKGGTITTPAVTLFYALTSQLERIAAEGLEERWARHAELARLTAEWAARRDFELPVAVEHRSPTVTALRPPAGVEAPWLVAALAGRGYTVGPGYGEWKPSSFRIGHMGEVRRADLEGLFEMCEALLDG